MQCDSRILVSTSESDCAGSVAPPLDLASGDDAGIEAAPATRIIISASTPESLNTEQKEIEQTFLSIEFAAHRYRQVRHDYGMHSNEPSGCHGSNKNG